MSTSSSSVARATIEETLGAELEQLQHAGLRRSLREVQQRHAGTVLLNGERVADFASNDYLGLASDARVARAAIAILQTEGTGAGAARLISGNHPLHQALEQELARFKRVDRALLFPAGYMANTGVIPALVQRPDVIYSDALNHASLIDGCRLSRATVRIFPHRDLDALASMLEADVGRYRRSLIVVEGVFSMDGDIFPLDQLVPLARHFGAWTYVDDAHGTGVMGATGRGTIEHFHVDGQVDVVVGTLGKAFGTSGAFVGGSNVLVEFLLNSARTFIFTTGTVPAIAAASLEALRIAQVEPWRRETVRQRARDLRAALSRSGRPCVGPDDGHIVPVRVGDALRTMALVSEMQQRGFLVGGVRPPTVPGGTSRLRISLSAAQAPEMVESLAQHLHDALRGSHA